MSAPPGGHQRIDRRSLALHRAIAEKLRGNPALLEIARDNLARWSSRDNHSQPYFDEWRRILEKPLPEILRVLEEDSERAAALRQATPFAGVLAPKERWAIYAEFAPERLGV
ncbi:MAG: hypothetical protein JST11_15100 [Acidobacteria bacterium]|nr:hypothetical protein [Acidobacteriota bacterium]